MKESNMLDLLELIKNHIFYHDGFWIYQDELETKIITSEEVREFIKMQGVPILERDITVLLDELTHNNIDFDIDGYIRESIQAKAKRGHSKYFASLDKLYPNNKFREIMNYYLFSDECYCFIFVGYGQTGKTTFVDLIANIIGKGTFGRSMVSGLGGNHGLSLLEGKTFFEVAEAQDLDLNTANMLKSIITNNDVYINPKFQSQRMIKPHVKVMMTCNSMPHFRIADDGILRRFIPIDMNEKIAKQNKNFLKEIESDIPYIIYEAMINHFNIDHFQKEKWEMFERDPQYGFGYGLPNLEYTYEKDLYLNYRNMCRSCGYMPKNKSNFESFIKLARKYEEEANRCVTISNLYVDKNGMIQSLNSEEEDLPF